MSDISHLFNRNIRFEGTLKHGGDEEINGRCQIVLNRIDPAEIEARFYEAPSSSMSIADMFMAAGEGISDRVQIEGELGRSEYLVTGPVRRSQSDTQGTRRKLRVDDIVEVEVTPGRDDKEGLKQVARFYLPPFDKLLSAFKQGTSRNDQHGFIHGWRRESPFEFEPGSWESSTKELKVGEHLVEVGLHFQFEQVEANFAESEIVTPQIRIKTELAEPACPDAIRDVREKIQNVQKDLMPLWRALRFALGRRANPSYQELSTYDYEDGIVIQGRRFWDRDNEVGAKPGRSPKARELWKLVEELVDRFNQLEGDALRRVGKAVDRYVEAFEVSTLELRLTLMHSALHLIVTKDEYLGQPNDVVPDDVPKPNSGGVNWGLAKAIGVLEIEWKDLFSAEVGGHEMYAFNRLRNDYLKRDKRGFMESTRPVRQVQRLFERVFLADLGNDPSDYSAIGRL